jgi:hypothetical protein
MTGVDDYMKQAADPANWPAGIQYDPEGDGTLLKSLGVYEHWNNPNDMKYSRNLHTGNGIELVKFASTSRDVYQSELTGTESIKAVDYIIYPNPFAESIRIDVSNNQALNLNVYNLQGQTVFSTPMNKTYIWDGTSLGGSKLPKGIYMIRLTEKTTGNLVWTEKVVFNKL